MVRFARHGAALALACLVGLPASVAAQEIGEAVDPVSLDIAPMRDVVAPAPQIPLAHVAGVDASRLRERRPAPLLPLYASFAVLQALDAHSTWRAIDRGAVESNPLLRGIAANEVGLIALKAAGTAGVIFATERLWTRNRVAALALMIATNSAMTWVVQHNYRAVR
jgi:hypothetical protein